METRMFLCFYVDFKHVSAKTCVFPCMFSTPFLIHAVYEQALRNHHEKKNCKKIHKSTFCLCFHEIKHVLASLDMPQVHV